jgi:Protein of unknown function (DUF3311)
VLNDAPGRGRRRASWLLALPLLGLAWPPLYNRLEPSVFGVPFFYAYQLAMIVIAVACMIVVYRTRSGRR